MFDVADTTMLHVLPGSEVPALHDGSAPKAADAIARADALHGVIARATRELFEALLEIDRSRAWEDDGARDLVHWVQMRYGISAWKAHRWVDAARALEQLPRVGEALANGELGVDRWSKSRGSPLLTTKRSSLRGRQPPRRVRSADERISRRGVPPKTPRSLSARDASGGG